jgi:hypothetical protein
MAWAVWICKITPFSIHPNIQHPSDHGYSATATTDLNNILDLVDILKIVVSMIWVS